MKSTKNPTVLLAALLVTLSVTAIAIITASEKTKFDNEIFASKVATINKVYNQYETINVTGYSNCIKSHSKDLCLTRMESISKHFANEYNSKLLKIVSAEYGIDTIENKESGRVTALGVKKTTLDYMLFGVDYIFSGVANIFDYKRSENLEFLKDEYSLKFYESSTPLRKHIQGLAENKDEVVSIGSKFAELGLKAQRENNQELTDVKKLLELYAVYSVGASQAVGKTPTVAEKVIDSTTKSNISTDGWNSHEQSLEAYKNIMERLELEEAKNSGAGSASGIGKAPSLMDTLTDSGQRFFDNVVLSPYNETIISVSGCNGEELKTEFCIKYLENQNIIINK